MSVLNVKGEESSGRSALVSVSARTAESLALLVKGRRVGGREGLAGKADPSQHILKITIKLNINIYIIYLYILIIYFLYIYIYL